ncbi:XTP/dITP diphosphatase [Trichlorobacter ammonificans]|uniref:dITP/XTP pyrophosphatase n=1 Tax=Trichlorobacter ammonificans TaxID=2916410 RepID=A0ABM9D7K6_9BACT|nr:XTP/dITP diphosphatase [Trichlorobacter ammonificans]CAH2031200.1 dITP/XTP pyrophosphatase [Trichlorobacter ammonificans]
MKQLLVATRNRGKMKEIGAYLKDSVEELLCLVDLPHLPETVEDGTTFAENALKKAREASAASGLPVIADDSGLTVDALNGLPGVISARYAGEPSNDEANNRKLLRELKDIPADRRGGAFVCMLAFVHPDGTEALFEGKIAGRILETPRGDGGFGYDPLLLIPDQNATMAELSVEQKNRISHRGQALRAFSAWLRESGR